MLQSLILAISNGKALIFGVILVASLGANLYQHQQLQAQQLKLELCQQDSKSARIIDDMNRQTSAANQLVLQNAIDKQNAMFTKLYEMNNTNNNAILVSIKSQQATTASQYAQISKSIESINIDTCQGLVDALITFPHTSSWNPK